MKEQKIAAISDGTVIDHIPPQNTFKIAEILNVKMHNSVVSVATNLDSKKIGKKGIVKIAGRSLTPEELNKVALLAPHATVSIIRNFKVVKKTNLQVPKEAINIILCNNPSCITNMEKAPTKFAILQDKPIKARCHYCERVMQEQDIKIL